MPQGPFDVLICFHPSDDEWVATHLLPPIQEAGFGILIHRDVRDCPEGVELPPLGPAEFANLGLAITRSRRVLVVMSNAWIGSFGDEAVAAMAQDQGIRLSQWSVIPLYCEPIPAGRIPPHIAFLTGLELFDPTRFAQRVRRLIDNLRQPVPGMREAATSGSTIAELARDLATHGPSIVTVTAGPAPEPWAYAMTRLDGTFGAVRNLLESVRRLRNEPPADQPHLHVTFLAADPPVGSRRLNLLGELAAIKEALQLAGLHDRFTLRLEPVTNSSNFQRALQHSEDTILHFSGHGTPEGLALVGADGRPEILPHASFADLLRIHATDGRRARGVVLNACYSEALAAALEPHTEFVVGWTAPMLDTAAILFSAAFYEALAAGCKWKTAFQLGRWALEARQLPDAGLLRDHP